jgi:hypothetical protein
MPRRGRSREPGIVAGFQRFIVLWTYLALSAWTAFLLVFPAMCLARGLAGAAILLGLLGLFLDIKALDHLLAWSRGAAPHLRNLVIVYHAGIAVLGLAALLQPIDPAWTRVPGSEARSDLMVAYLPSGLVVRSYGGPAELHADDGAVHPLDYPGGPSWTLQSGPDASLWLAPDEDPRLHVRDPAGVWSIVPRPAGRVRTLAIGRDSAWLVTTDLHRFDRSENRWTMVTDCERPTGVALAPDERELLVVGRHWCSSADGEHFTDLTPPVEEFNNFPAAAIGGDGWRYVFSGGRWRSTLHVRGPDDPGFVARTPPASDIRVLIADPVDGRRAHLATWGEGVFTTADGGATWQSLGLERVQIRSIALDVTRTHLAVGGSNTIFDRGAYFRPLP